MLAFAIAGTLAGQDVPTLPLDSDGDGLSDMLEQALLERFQPQFLIARHDCAIAPSRFAENLATPTPALHRQATIYGEVFPVHGTDQVELHFYHLWTQDCGRHGHPLDVEHVSALLQSDSHGTADDWRAIYWYAGAHEGTVCDRSRIYSAAALGAEAAGPKVWISQGKHASYLAPEECSRGCGADTCADVVALPAVKIINVGEAGRVMNGATWTAASSWQFPAKMRSDFAGANLALFAAGGEPSIAVGGRPMRGFQRAVAIASQPAAALSLSADKTDSALNLANEHTDSALEIGKRHVVHALGRAFQHMTRFLDDQ